MKSGGAGTDSSITRLIGNIEELIKKQDFAQALEAVFKIETGAMADLTLVEEGQLCLAATEALYYTAKYSEGIERASRAIECFKPTDAHGLFGRAKHLRGRMYLELGQIPRAIDDFNEAIFAFWRIDDTEGEFHSCNFMAKCSFMQSQFERAKEHLQRGLQLSKNLGQLSYISIIKPNLGRVMALLGDFQQAQDNLILEKSEFEKESPINQCARHESLAYLNILNRDFKKALAHLMNALDVAEANSLRREISIYHEYSGELAFWQGHYDKAEEHYREAIKIGMDIAPEGDLISQSYRLLAELQVARSQLDDAEESCDRAWTVAEKITERLELGAIQRTRGEIAARRGDADTARTTFENSIRSLSEIGAKYELARAHLQAGEAAVLDNDYRQFNLGLALALFKRIGVEYWQTRTAEALDRLPRPDGIPAGRTSPRLKTADTGGPFIAVSAPMQKILAHVEKIKDTDDTILLLGETGVGKDRLAEYIHHISNRAAKPFQIVSVANYPAAILPGELFGHTRGAFTGAETNKPGLLAAANGGTIYLDEISEVSETSQVMLLKFLERKEIQRLGEHSITKLDVRFIAASNRDLQQALKTGRFRRDLYHRLSREEITVPPLAQRPEDIPELALHFLTTLGFPRAKAAWLVNSPFGVWLQAVNWSGNIRQLQNILSRFKNRVDGAGESEMLNLGRELLAEAGLLVDPEREKLLALLEANNWNQRETARQMDLSYSTFRRHLERLAISIPHDD